MQFLRQVHRWLGLVLAIVILVVSVAGGLLLLRDPYYRAVHPGLGSPITAAQVEGRAGVLERIESRWAAEGVRLVKFPRHGLNAYHVWLRDGTEAFVHPQTAAVIDRWRPGARLPSLLFELHAHLLAERPGTVVNGIGALFLVFMVLTGVVLWWPARRGAFALGAAIPRRASAADLLRSHAAIGVLAAVPILVFAVTGAAIVFYEPIAAVLSTLLDHRAPQQPNAWVAARDVPTRPWGDILARVDATFPDGETVFYYPGTRENRRLMFRKQLPGEWHPNGRSYVLVDPYEATVVQAIDAREQGAGTRIMHAVYPVHAAKVGGGGMVALAAVTAVALSWLTAGGVWTYALRARRRARRPRRAGTMPEQTSRADARGHDRQAALRS